MIRNGTSIGVHDVAGKELCVGDTVQFGCDTGTKLTGTIIYDQARTEFKIAAEFGANLLIDLSLPVKLVRRYVPTMFEDALASQSACNLAALVHSLEVIVDHLQVVAWEQSKGTDWINKHPVIRLFAEQLTYLSCGRSYSEAHAICRAHAADYVAKYPQSEPPLSGLDYGSIRDPEFRLAEPEVV